MTPTLLFMTHANFSINYDIFNNPIRNWTFYYNYTPDVAKIFRYSPETIEAFGYLPFDVIIDWGRFDDYVHTNFVSPKLGNERVFEQL